jgi:hypothetical protein
MTFMQCLWGGVSIKNINEDITEETSLLIRRFVLREKRKM